MFKHLLILTTLIFTSAGTSQVSMAMQQSAPAERLTIPQLDQQIVKELSDTGECVSTEHIVLCAQDGTFDEDTLTTLIARFDEGAVAIRQYLGSQIDMPGNGSQPIEFFVHSDVGVPHTTIFHEPWIFLNIDTITHDMIPYLHEMVHVMAQWSWRTSEWVGEGFANHVAAHVAESGVGYHRSFVLSDGLDSLLEFCSSDAGAAMLPLVGEPGRRNTFSGENAAIFRKMMSDRRAYAPAYYAMSWSFTDYLIDKVEIEGLRAIAESQEPSAVAESISGKTIEEHKRNWRQNYCHVG
ncbi:MAG: hypothetical protein JJU03_00290 [Idiomarina sp.]|nr:hypothetical protein [Idiomarina sp.]